MAPSPVRASRAASGHAGGVGGRSLSPHYADDDATAPAGRWRDLRLARLEELGGICQHGGGPQGVVRNAAERRQQAVTYCRAAAYCSDCRRAAARRRRSCLCAAPASAAQGESVANDAGD